MLCRSAMACRVKGVALVKRSVGKNVQGFTRDAVWFREGCMGIHKWRHVYQKSCRCG